MYAFLLLALPAFAFRPDPSIVQGSEPTRVRRYHTETQHVLQGAPAWAAFTQGEGQGWVARFDERTGNPYRAWGPGIPMGTLQTSADVERALRGVLDRNAGLLGLDPSALVLARAGYIDRTDTWYVRFEQQVAGADGPVPVYRGAVEARVRFGKLILLGVETYPDAAGVDTRPALTAAEATARAIAQGPAPQETHEVLGVRPIIVPLDDGNRLDYYLAYEVRTRTAEPLGLWNTLIDAQTGETLNVYNEIKFISGTISGTHDTRTVDGSYSTSNYPYLYLVGDDGSETYTDADGAYDLPDASSATAYLTGERVCVENSGRAEEGELAVTGDATWTTTDGDQAEIDSYLFLHTVIDWKNAYAPEVSVASSLGRSDCPESSDVILSIVNQNSYCNAYYDGNVNFYRSGGGCSNTAQIADVNYHEWGHGFHYYNLVSGTYDSSISEGIGDSISAMNTGDATIGPYFYTTGGGIREVSTDYSYPDDVTGETHQDGLIFAGSVWDLWAELETTYGEGSSTAYDVLSEIFVGGLKGGPDIAGSYDEFVAADDDNGDLSDGTPHQCELINAFGLHGLGPGGSSVLVSLGHTPVENQAAGAGSYPVEASVTSLAPTCASANVTSAVVGYSTDGGATWTTAALTSADDAVTGAIPAQPSGTIVQYYVSATMDDGTVVSAPSGATINPFTFYVGELTEINCETFEDDDGDFTHELVSGTDELGADDWVWSRPRGAGGDPDAAYSGNKVWGNDLGGGNYNGEYQDEIHNRLSSPEYDISGHDRVILQFRRWLQVEDGYYDKASLLVNGAEVWSNHASSRSVGDEHTEDGQWSLQTVEIPLDGTGKATLSWDIESDGGLTFGGWTLDDVCLYSAGAVVVDTGGDSGGDDTAIADDTAAPSDSGSPDSQAPETGAPDTGGLVIKPGGCTCASAAEPSSGLRAAGVLGALALVFARRRR